MKQDNEQLGIKQELHRFEQMLRDPSITGNPLFPHLQRLVFLAGHLESNCEKLTRKSEQLATLTAEYNRSLELATRIDPLTRLANRRDITERLVREESRAQRHWRLFSLVLVEVDDLKLINDVHGFNAGDELLVEIACALQICVRSEDICGRWEGDRFIVLLAETGLEGAVTVAEKIVKSIAMTEFGVNRTVLRTTVSAALGEYRTDQNVHEFVASLERAVQQARQEGKNRFVVV